MSNEQNVEITEENTNEEVLDNNLNEDEDVNEGIDNTNNVDNNDNNEDINSEISELLLLKEKEAKDNQDKYLRIMAEYDNFRKRTIKEKSDMYDKGVMDTTGKFLEVLDNFKRALSQFNIEELTDKEKNICDGLILLEKQFNQIVNSIGVKEIEAVGQEFNPNVHNAVTHAEDENFGENMVSEEYQKGYMYNEKVIRYSQVKVVN